MKTRNMSWKRKGFILAFLAPTVIAFVLFYLYPIVTVFVTSFCKWDYTNITSPEFFGFADMWNNYKYIFELYPYFWDCLLYTSRYGAGNTAGRKTGLCDPSGTFSCL